MKKAHHPAILILDICSLKIHRQNRNVQSSKIMQTTLTFINNIDQINYGRAGQQLKRTRLSIYVLILYQYIKTCLEKSMLQSSTYNKTPFLFKKCMHIIVCRFRYIHRRNFRKIYAKLLSINTLQRWYYYRGISLSTFLFAFFTERNYSELKLSKIHLKGVQHCIRYFGLINYNFKSNTSITSFFKLWI